MTATVLGAARVLCLVARHEVRCIEVAGRAFLAEVEAGLPDLASLPTLIIWGDADLAFRSEERQRWERTCADHHTVMVEGAGHFVQSDAPDRFAAAIREWHTSRSAPRSG